MLKTKYTAIIGHLGSSVQWEERLAIPGGVDPETYIRAMLDDFNALETARYGDKAKLREFISVDTTGGTRLCTWIRVNAVTLTDSKGIYNQYQCGECKLTVRTGAFAHPGEKECHPERVCTICSREFANVKNLARHIVRKHLEDME